MSREGAHRRFGLLLRVGISGSSSQPRCPSPSLSSNTSGGFSVLEDASPCAFPQPARQQLPSTPSHHRPPHYPPTARRRALSPSRSCLYDQHQGYYWAVARQRAQTPLTRNDREHCCTSPAAQPQPKADLPSTTLDPERALHRWRRTSSIRRAYSAGVHHCRWRFAAASSTIPLHPTLATSASTNGPRPASVAVPSQQLHCSAAGSFETLSRT